MNVFSAVYIFLIHLCFCPLGCSYLFEVQNEVHNNSSLEIYYQVHLHANGMTFGGWGDRRQGRDTKPPSPPFFFTQSVVSVLKSPVLNVNVMQVYCSLIRFFSNLSLVVSSPAYTLGQPIYVLSVT